MKCLLIILSLSICGCGGCETPLHDQFGIHMNNWKCESSITIDSSDEELYSVVNIELVDINDFLIN